jgi:hypothetical protein
MIVNNKRFDWPDQLLFASECAYDVIYVSCACAAVDVLDDSATAADGNELLQIVREELSRATSDLHSSTRRALKQLADAQQNSYRTVLMQVTFSGRDEEVRFCLVRFGTFVNRRLLSRQALFILSHYP